MSVATAADVVRTVDGVPLKTKLRRAERQRKLKAVGLVLPLFLFIILGFVTPIGVMLFNAVHDNEFLVNLPNTMAALTGWDGKDLPDEPVYAALAEDFKVSWKNHTAAEIGQRMNYEMPGARSKVMASARLTSKLTAGPYKQAIIAIDPMWGDMGVWNLLKRGTGAYTPYFLLRALDFQYDEHSNVIATPPETAIFRDIFGRTLFIAIVVTLATLLLGYPVAYLLASLPLKISNLLMIMVLLPFWTSLLVRTTAWVVLLQQHGVINDALQSLHLINQPLELIFNRFGTVLAMTHIQLPFTLLPIYSVMKTISPSHVRAARSLGAGPFYAFWRIYFPQTLPGIGAGCLLTFILSLGYYITPALVGGPTDQMVSYFVALYTNRELNWGMASSLGAILLVATLLLYFVYNKLVGVDRLKLS
jgi:putative spermidine/putrescine transport system permease protein